MNHAGLPTSPSLSSTLNTGGGPAVSPTPEFALMTEKVVQWAIQVAASGAWDAEGLAAHEGLLPEETRIVSEIARMIEENPIHREAAEALNIAGAFEVDYGNEVNRAHLESESRRIKKLILVEKQKRQSAVDVLKGRQRHEGGASYTGSVPPAPVVPVGSARSLPRVRLGLALRAVRLKRFFVDKGATLASLVLEAVVISGPVALATRSDDPWHAMAYSFSGVLLATALPHLVGTTAAGLIRGARLTWRKWVTMLFVLPWLLAVFLLATLRTEYSEQVQRTILAISQKVAPADVNLTGHFDWNSQLALWSVLMLGTGLAIIAIKLAAYNPALTSVVRHDNVIAAFRFQLAPVRAALGHLSAQREAQKRIGDRIPDQFSVFEKKVLPAFEKELLSVFRSTLVRALADPESSGILARAAETHAKLTAVRPAAEESAA